MSKNLYPIFENYIYLYHVDKFILLPIYPDTLSETLGITFNTVTPLSSTAPIYSFTNAGPRSIHFQFTLHRDLMKEINYNVSNVTLDIGDDYVDTLVKYMQAAVLPNFDSTSKVVNPPMIAIRIGNEIYCKGVIKDSLGLTHSGPILDTDKYACVGINFTVYEVDPYDAKTVMEMGSFRGLNTTLERKFTSNIIL